jgi:RHS repeat-associated protein
MIYVYGRCETTVEQISSGGTVSYLHHDQAGSTRMITGSTGTVTGKCTYSPYGTPTCEGTTTTPLGYDAQYTSSDTGLIYLRARTYDPATGQFLSRDPLVALTGRPYSYGADNPVNNADPDGLSAEGIEGVPCIFPFCGPSAPAPAPEALQHGLETVEHGLEGVWNAINENEGPNDEGEAELREKKPNGRAAGTRRSPLDRAGNGRAKDRSGATKGRGSTLRTTKACIQT